MIFVTRPFERDRLVIGQHCARLHHALERMPPIFGAPAADAFPAQMSLTLLPQEFQNRLHDANVRFDAGDDDLPLRSLESGPEFFKEPLKAGVAATAETRLIQVSLGNLQLVESGADLGMGRTQSLGVLFR